jgi:hypothetical protein
VLWEHEVGAGESRTRCDEAAHDRHRDAERRVGDDAERPRRQAQVGCVDPHDLHRLACETFT